MYLARAIKVFEGPVVLSELRSLQVYSILYIPHHSPTYYTWMTVVAVRPYTLNEYQQYLMWPVHLLYDTERIYFLNYHISHVTSLSILSIPLCKTKSVRVCLMLILDRDGDNKTNTIIYTIYLSIQITIRKVCMTIS
jgi:hypothetical protein